MQYCAYADSVACEVLIRLGRLAVWDQSECAVPVAADQKEKCFWLGTDVCSMLSVPKNFYYVGDVTEI